MTRLIDTAALERALEEFAKARDWEQFHSPKNLAMALTGEVGELVELFQWLTEAQSRDAMKDPALAMRIQEEMADVMLYLVRMASVLGVDLDAAVGKKLTAVSWQQAVKNQQHFSRSDGWLAADLQAAERLRQLRLDGTRMKRDHA